MMSVMFFSFCTHGAAPRSSASLGSTNGAQLPATAAARVKQVCTVRFESAHACVRRHFEPLEHSATFGVHATKVTLVTFPGAVPELTVDPRHSRDEAIGLDGLPHFARFRVDAMDLALSVLPNPQAA